MQTAERTSSQWAAVIGEFGTKRQASRERVEALNAEKQGLALDAAMGSTEARKRLDKIGAELARLSNDASELDLAIAHAGAEQKKAAQAEADTAEQQRHGEMAKLAREVIRHSIAFTAALGQAIKAAGQAKAAVQNMVGLAKPGEHGTLEKVLGPGPWMRAAEHGGLRAHLEFAPYSGPREHLGPLDAELGVYLAPWLEPSQKGVTGNGS